VSLPIHQGRNAVRYSRPSSESPARTFSAATHRVLRGARMAGGLVTGNSEPNHPLDGMFKDAFKAARIEATYCSDFQRRDMQYLHQSKCPSIISSSSRFLIVPSECRSRSSSQIWYSIPERGSHFVSSKARRRLNIIVLVGRATKSFEGNGKHEAATQHRPEASLDELRTSQRLRYQHLVPSGNRSGGSVGFASLIVVRRG
jgi:hypothetical protein